MLITYVCQQQGKLTQAIFVCLMGGGEVTKRSRAEREKEESLTHLLT